MNKLLLIYCLISFILVITLLYWNTKTYQNGYEDAFWQGQKHQAELDNTKKFVNCQLHLNEQNRIDTINFDYPNDVILSVGNLDFSKGNRICCNKCGIELLKIKKE